MGKSVLQDDVENQNWAQNLLIDPPHAMRYFTKDVARALELNVSYLSLLLTCNDYVCRHVVSNFSEDLHICL